MQNIKQKLLLLLAAPLFSYPVLGQSQQHEPAAQQVQMLLADEQVRLVHSQPWYAAGERLWFQAFVNRISSRPPSRVLYVELQDTKGHAIVSQRLIVEEGMAKGDVLLPKGLPSGTYTLRATTNWMRNFSEQQQFREQLLVVNPAEVMALRGKAPVAAERQLKVQFFPESNSLLAGVATRVAAVVTNAAGIGIAAQGTVENAAGETIASFRSDYTGVGAFKIRPTSQEQYVVQVLAEGYQAQRAELPKAKPNGLAMAVKSQDKAGIRVDVRSTMPWNYTLLAESGGKVYFSHKAKTSGIATVPWQAKPGEAVRLLLLNPAGLVEAEQKVLLPQEEKALQVSTDRMQYSTRQQVRVTLQGLPQAAQVAVAVAGRQPDLHRPLAFKPATWGAGQPEKVLLTYIADEELWTDMAAGRSEAPYELEQFVDAFPQSGVAEASGVAGFSTSTDTAFVLALPEGVVAYAQKHHTRAHLEEIYGLTEPHAVAPLHRLPADRVFKLDDYVTFASVEEAIKEVTTNVRMGKKKGRHMVRLLYVGNGTKRMMKKEPLYLLDGVVVDGMEEMLALDLHDIASIEIAWTEEKLYAGNLGHLTDNGMFAIYTKSGEARERLKEKGRPVLYGHYNQPNIFVASLAGNTDATAAAGSIPDFRQLTFWEPQLRINDEGKASFTFYTSDETGTFTIQVKGQTAEGIPVSGEATFEVKLMN